MVVGEWNRSVVLTYLGSAIACIGIGLIVAKNCFDGAMICLLLAGACDLFDGYVARKIKRTSAQKAFGIELDSLADVIDFVALPIVILLCSCEFSPLIMVVAIYFAICGIARLAFFNTIVNKTDGPVKFYRGLPVTYTALIIPIAGFLASRYLPSVPGEMLACTMAIVACLNIFDLRIPKPRGAAYGVLVALGIAVICGFVFL